MSDMTVRPDTVEPELTPKELKYWAEYAALRIAALRTLKDSSRGSCVIACNGSSLKDIPNSWLNTHNTFGLNYCHKREGFSPTFFLVGDISVAEHEWTEAYERHAHIPMFLPSPGMDSFGTSRENVYSYVRVKRHGKPVGDILDPTEGISFTSVAHAATIVAAYMGFTRILYVGLDGKEPREHFYGKGYPNDYNRLGDDAIAKAWNAGFGRLREMLPKHVELLNLSTDTAITTLPRDNWLGY